MPARVVPPSDGRAWQVSALIGALLLGLVAGATGWYAWQDQAALASLRAQDGALLAQGRLASALDEQLATRMGGVSDPSSSVRIGMSFLARDGQYCRSFEQAGSTGLACRVGGHWQIPLLVQSAPVGIDAGAASVQPPALLDAIGARIAGAPLSVAAERAAQARGWATDG